MASRWLNAQSDGNSTPMAEIFVASVNIEVGEEITPEKMKLEQWPADRVPPGSSSELESLQGKFAKQRFYEGEAIMPVKLMDDNWTEVPRSYRVVAMRASDSGISNLIQPGDRVDVSAFFDKSDLVPQSTTRTVLRGVRVYALDGDTERRVGDERPKTLKNIQLLIHERETAAWEMATQIGKVSLLVSSEAASEDDNLAAGEDFVAWLGDLQDRQEQRGNPKERAVNYEPRSSVALAPAPAPTKPEGFKMIKHSGGQVIEYWIEPGKLPRRMGEVGEGDSSADSEPGFDEGFSTGEAVSGSGDRYDSAARQAQFSYLNGQTSPFFQNSEQN